jgi:uncharacterized protein
MDLVKVGDVLEFRIIGLDKDRRRISLSRKSERPAGERPPASAPAREAGGPKGSNAGEKKKVLAVRKAGPGVPPAAPQRPAAPPRQFGSSRPDDDDGTMYNPFAEAFKKMREKK